MPQLYTQRLSRKYPGLFVILIDQSGSMSETIHGMEPLTKADYAAIALNDMIYSMVKQGKFDASTGLPRKYAYLSVLGYGSAVSSLMTPNGDPIDIPFISGHPLKYDVVEREDVDNVTGAIVRRTDNVPIWIEPRALGMTEMANSLYRARDIIQTWLTLPPEPDQGARQDCLPPIVLNITDGEHRGQGNPIDAARELTRLQTSYGNVLLYNCHFTRDLQNPTVFPSSVNQVSHLNPFAAALFEMSSIIPDALREKAQAVNNGRPVEVGARGMVYNSDVSLLIKFLKWGTEGTANVE